MKFSELSNAYREVFPVEVAKPRQLVETMTGTKDIDEHEHDEVIDTTIVRDEQPKVDEVHDEQLKESEV